MSQTVLERLAETRRHLKRILWIHGLCWLVLGALSAITVAALVDWLFHVSSGMRVLFLITVAAVAGYVAYRWLLRPLSVPFSDLALAQRLERLHPELREVLSSSIDFLKHSEDDPLYGSRSLRERVVERAVKETDHLTFDEMVESRPAKQAGMWTVGLLVVVGSLVLTNPSDASIALKRLANPF